MIDECVLPSLSGSKRSSEGEQMRLSPKTLASKLREKAAYFENDLFVAELAQPLTTAMQLEEPIQLCELLEDREGFLKFCSKSRHRFDQQHPNAIICSSKKVRSVC